jgi:hypothetical protein
MIGDGGVSFQKRSRSATESTEWSNFQNAPFLHDLPASLAEVDLGFLKHRTPAQRVPTGRFFCPQLFGINNRDVDDDQTPSGSGCRLSAGARFRQPDSFKPRSVDFFLPNWREPP